MSIYSHTTGFTRGEVDASLYDRFDVDFFRAASEFMENWFPDVTGAVSRRPGFAPVEMNGEPFQLPRNSPQLPPGAEPSELYMRSFLFRGSNYLLVFRKEVEGGYQSVLLSCYRIVGDTVTAEIENHFLAYYSDVATALDFTPDDPPPSTAGGGLPTDFSHPLSRNIAYAQVGPAVFITSPLFPPYRVFVRQDGTVGIEVVQWFEELLGTVEVAGGAGSWTGEDTLFQDQLEVGDSIRFSGQTFTVATIPSQTSLTTDESWTGVSLAGERVSTPTNVFEFEWPRLVTFHRGRLFLFSSEENPVKMWASRANDPFVILAGSAYDDAPINIELFTEGAESFRWVATTDRLFLGGEQAEYTIVSEGDGPITPTTFSFYRVSSIGGASLPPFAADASIVFVNRGRTQVQSVTFDFSRSGFVGEDISLLSPHLLDAGVADIIYRPGTRNDRAPRIFVLTDDRKMRTCAFSERENVVAWSRVAVSDGYVFEAMAATPDDLFVALRVPNEDTVAVGRLDIQSDTFYTLDLEWLYQATAGVVALDPIHQNTTVAVLDGPRFVGFFDTTDELDIGDAGFGGALTVGVAFNSRLDLLPVILPEQPQGGTLNRKHRLVRVLVSVQEAYQLVVNGEPLFGNVVTNLETGLPLRRGTFERRFLGWTERPQTVIESATIYRATLRSVTREVNL